MVGEERIIKVDANDTTLIAQALTRIADSNEATNQRLSSHDVRLESLTNAVETMSKTMSETMVQIRGLVGETTRIEEKTLSQIDEVRKNNDKLFDKVESIDTRVKILELDKAGHLGEEKTKKSYNKWWSDNWFKIGVLIVAAAPAIVFVTSYLGGK